MPAQMLYIENILKYLYAVVNSTSAAVTFGLYQPDFPYE